ncbi:MAG: transglycosylase domain-containing protein [Verrucomicrobiae bacterium]|nr:transglycosylase domain-containing protein [Verrucomicrobiae bacterium]
MSTRRPKKRVNPSAARAPRAGDDWTLMGPLSRWWTRHPRLQAALAVAGFGAGLLAIAGAGIFFHYDRQAARFDLRQVARMPRESTIHDIQGEVIGYLHGDGRVVVPLEEVSDWFRKALVAREDSRFYHHGGIDRWALFRAGMRNAKDGDAVQGASTLTMQLARNTFDLREKTLRRKLVEMALARRIERAYSKEEILRLYVNRIFFGSGLNGIEQAARGYFGKSAAELDLAESAMIAGIIRAPNRFSPFRHYEDAIREMTDTLDRMAKEGTISSAEAETAKRRRPAVLPQESGMRIAGLSGRVSEDNELLEAVRLELPNLLSGELLEDGGFEIHTTFDLALQGEAEAAVEARLGELERQPGYPHPTLAEFGPRFAADPSLAPDYLQAAVCVIDNRSGAIRAMVGGRNFGHSRFNRAWQAKRPLGSVFKPLAYATAFETGLFPGTYISDDPIRPGEIQWFGQRWSPENADGRFLGLVPAERGLIESRNTTTVRVGERAGIDAVLTMIEHAGLAAEETIRPTPQIYIGNLEATLTSLVSAYSAFPDEGYRHRPFFIERIATRDGTEVFSHEPAGYRVVSAGAGWLTTQLMRKALEPGGTGAAVRSLGLSAPAGGKTGTTNDYHDAWFAGFTSQLTAGVWVGMDRPEKIVDRGYGGRIALPIWTDVMLAAERLGYRFGDLPEAADPMEVELCRYSGLLAGETCRRMDCAYHETAPSTMIPREICAMHSRVDLTEKRDAAPGDGKRGLLGKLRGLLGLD